MTTVTSENLAEFNAQRLGMGIEAEAKPEAKPEEVDVREHRRGRPGVGTQFSELREARRVAEEAKAAAEAKASAAEERAKAAEAKAEEQGKEKARADAAEARAQALEERLNPAPVVPDEPPDPQKYTDPAKFREDTRAWAKAQAQKEVRQERVLEKYRDRLADAKKELADYDDVMAAAANVAVSDDVRDAILSSALGPQITYHLAKHPDVAARLNAMDAKQQMREFGRIERGLEAAPAPSPAPTSAAVFITPRAKPPEPVSPIRAISGSDNKVTADGEFTGTPAEYRALRRAGKIK
jgi:hypothetical protein